MITVAGIFSITFALSIDYQVFLLTRMREEFVRTQSGEQAIEFGIAKTARVVTGAAAIMVAVFLAFALADFMIIKQFGIGLATAVLIDATIVRLVLLPALMRLLGERAWWMPELAGRPAAGARRRGLGVRARGRRAGARLARAAPVREARHLAGASRRAAARPAA